MKSAISKILVLLACVALVAGCGKFLGHADTASKLTLAQESLAKAKAAGAETKAPAEYYMAVEWLKAAEHEVQEGDRPAAKEWAEKSEQYSKAALQKAGGGAK
jgi:uncharacterized secreted protein with C-terminal beta-propeller domain